MAYKGFKDLVRRTTSDKVFCDTTFNINKDPKYDRYQRGLASMVYKFFDKQSKGSGFKYVVKNEIKQNEQLAEELHKRITGTFEKRKVYLSFKDSFWRADLADIQLMSKLNKGIWFSLCAFDILDESKCKPNKIWVDKGSEFCNRSMKSCLQDNNIEMYSTHNEGKSVVAERFIRTVNTKIYKLM